MISRLYYQLISRLPAPLQNRYYLALLVFFFWMCFLDRQSLYTQWSLARSKSQLEQDKSFYLRKIEEAKEEAQTFEDNKERYAREHFFMKKGDEEVFIFDTK